MAKSTKTLSQLLTPYFCELYGLDGNQEFEIEYINAEELLTIDRLDLVPKLRWIEAHEKKQGIDFANHLYDEHILAITGRTGKEPGKEDEKDSPEKFRMIFSELLKIKENGFDENQSVIPVGMDNNIMDGAHRTSIGIYNKMKIPIVRFPQLFAKNNPEFFLFRLMERSLVEVMVSDYCKMTKNNIYVACVWPIADDKEKREQTEKLLKERGKFIYKKEIELDSVAIRNLVIQIYGGVDWLGGVADHFVGASTKANSVWKKGKSTIFYFFEGPELNEVLALKDEIRDIFQLDKHSIHITDNNQETLDVAHMILNENSLDLIMHGAPDKYIKLNLLIEKFKQHILSEGLDLEDYVVDSSSVIALYGLRESKDLDYLTLGEKLEKINDKDIEEHGDYLSYHLHPLDELIRNPKHYLYYNGVKFISLQCAREFKENRGEAKDKYDVKLIDSLTKSTWSISVLWSKWNYDVQRKFKFYYRKFKDKLKSINWVYAIYSFLKKK